MTTRSVHLTPTCDWGGCDRIDVRSVTHEDATWLLCPPHVAEHYVQHPKPKRQPREMLPCGTNAAYRRHIRSGEKPCNPCAYAHSEDEREKHRKRRLRAGLPEFPPSRPLQPCGTRAAYRRHLKQGEQPCETCLSVLKRRAA